MSDRTAIIIPTYGHFAYAVRAIDSALKKTAGEPFVFIIDDASPDWLHGVEAICQRFWDAIKSRRVIVHHFSTNGGLHRSWNRGLKYAREFNCRFACVTNSDVVFSQGWNLQLAHACVHCGYRLTGPLTNGPGTEDGQWVGHFVEGYQQDDSQSAIDSVGFRLKELHGGSVDESRLNGFCLFAETEAWFGGEFDDQHVFCPSNPFDQSGNHNPTPLMTEGEYELQKRWSERDWKAGICRDSFVFHYRSVTRGPHHCGTRFFRSETMR